jgi:non-canonical (house-cleaning) NTP pyrophosphatase
MQKIIIYIQEILKSDEIGKIVDPIYQDDPIDRSTGMIHYFQFVKCDIFCQIEMIKN